MLCMGFVEMARQSVSQTDDLTKKEHWKGMLSIMTNAYPDPPRLIKSDEM